MGNGNRQREQATGTGNNGNRQQREQAATGTGSNGNRQQREQATTGTGNGKYDDAEPLFKWVLVICEEILESMHLDMALSLNDLAALYYNQSKFDDTELLYKRALAIHEEILETMHPTGNNGKRQQW
jgi:tetratricopeptide (TPR) repeat protein